MRKSEKSVKYTSERNGKTKHYDKTTHRHSKGIVKGLVIIACVLGVFLLLGGGEYYFVKSKLNIGDAVAIEDTGEETVPEIVQNPAPVPERAPSAPSVPITPPKAPDTVEVEEPREEIPQAPESEHKPDLIPDTGGGAITNTAMSEWEKEVAEAIFSLTNTERQKQGLAPYGFDGTLQDVAQRKSVNMGELNYFSHIAPDGTTTHDWLRADGHSYRAWGENIFTASWGASGAEIVNAWMNSSGHRANILGDFELLGVGVYQLPDGSVYSTQVFGTK